MCGRVFVRTTLEQLLHNFAFVQAAGRVEGMANEYPRWNGAPGNDYPIIIKEPDVHGPVFKRARWGFMPSWAKSAGDRRPPINARCEGIATNGMFKYAYGSRRALMPIDGFFEWWDVLGTGKNKRPYAIAMKNDQPFCLGAIWEDWNDPAIGVISTFAVITTEANELMAKIHPRMPLIIAPEDYGRWLDPDLRDARDLLKPFPADRMKMWPIGSKVGNYRNNSPDILDLVEEDPTDPGGPGTLL